MKHVYTTRPAQCPECGSQKIAEILYGFIYETEELKKQHDAGEIVYGGCLIRDPKHLNPVWRCTACETDFFRSEKPIDPFLS